MASTTSSALTTLDERGLAHLAQEKAGVGRVRVVTGAVQRPLVHGHDEIQHGQEYAERKAHAPFEQTAAPQRNDHVKAPAEQKRVGNQRDILEQIVRGAQALVIELPRFGNFQEFVVAV